VPLSTAALPPFPYLEWPKKVPEGYRFVPRKSDFDRAYFVAGDGLHKAEGKLEIRKYGLRDAGLSQLEAMRNYDSAITSLGGVRIDTASPLSDAFLAKNGGDRHDISANKLGIGEAGYEYASYLIRTPGKQAWISVAVSSVNAVVVVLEEQALEQKIGLVKAEAMKAELDQKGRVALYINFDTDKAVLREDGKPAVDEIARLLRGTPALKVSVEGHTDNSGDAARNRRLSEERARAVVAALIAAGIEPARLSAAGFGADKPLADNASEDGRARNRRVELVKI
jgi:outer membrane protein OmpA-like peptidoglycan-associated protein